MRRSCYRGLIGPILTGLACLAVAGCAVRPAVTPAESLTLLQTGRPVLTCREACLAEWQRALPQAAQLDAGRYFHDLALLVMRVGYQDDLTLYYLGRAAEGMGYRAAAVSYYRQSMQLSGTSIACQYLSRQCGGVSLPRAAAARLAAVERMRSPSRARRIGATQSEPEAPETAPLEAAPAEMAVPPQSPVPSSGPSPAAHPAGPSTYDYIEPPPAAR
jgi:hypothetical protein